MADEISITNITHPEYDSEQSDISKFRLTIEGGDSFKSTYLKKFSSREPNKDFNSRLAICHVPAHAKAALWDIKNAIFQRLVDVTRVGGPNSYQSSIDGQNRGVDLRGNSMTGFIGRQVLPELLPMRKVGVFVDKPGLPHNASLADARGVRPYLYIYQTEDIRCWSEDDFGNLTALLLRDHIDQVDDHGLITKRVERFRLLKLEPQGGVSVQFFNDTGTPTGESFLINIDEIPFVRFELNESLLKDVADYQIALMNMGSSDINYSLKSNYPFYVEQFSPLSEIAGIKSPDDTGEQTESQTSDAKTVNVGVTQGRKYPKGLDQPAFIHPSPEPLLASMKKQAELREEIRELVNLALTSIEPRRASAESKALDMQSLEAGLSFIGLELEYGEREISRIWAKYDNSDPATVTYPRSYGLRTDDDRLEEADKLGKLIDKTPSITYQKTLAKQIIKITVGHKVDETELAKMNSEIDKAPVIQSDVKTLTSDLEAGLVTIETASKIRGYPPDEAQKAIEQREKRMAERAAAQSPGGDPSARGLEGGDLKASSEEKAGKPKRGEQATKTASE